MDSGATTLRFAAAHTAFERKIRTYARHTKHSAPRLDVEDVEAELLAVLWRCVQTYDPDNGATFNTYAQRSFQNKCASLVRADRAEKRRPPAGIMYIDAPSLSGAIESRYDLLPPTASAEDCALLRMLEVELVAKEEGRRAERNRGAIRSLIA